MRNADTFARIRERVIAALYTLPMDQRATYVLSALDGLDYEAISFRLGIPQRSVENCLAEAIIALGPVLRDSGWTH